MELIRHTGLETLTIVLKNKKNCDTFEKYIYEKTNKDENFYKWVIYQITGLLLKDRESMRDVLKSLKNGKIGWKSDIYDSVRTKIEEYDDYLLKPFEVVEGVVQCGKCQSKKTWSVQKQTRGGDEPMTTFSRCVECGHQWSYSG